MRRNAIFWAWIGGLVSLSVGAIAADRIPHQYDTIVERNLFGLKEHIVEPTPQVMPDLPKVYLSGVAHFGRKVAFLRIVPVGKSAASAAAEQSLILTEGEKQGVIKVLEIDEKAGRVRINNSGTVMDLTFEKDAPRANPPANVAEQPGLTPNPPGWQPHTPYPALTNTTQPLAAPASYPNPGMSTGKRAFPGRALSQNPAPLPPGVPASPVPASPEQPQTPP
jgi:hypothetical protein